jgi:hypothetical protein
VRWNIICQPKDQGGLGILNIDAQNRCLLSKWLFKLINKDGLWQNMLRPKYLRTQTIVQVQRKPGDSSDLMRVKESFLSLGHFKLNNGENIRFWKDKWMGNVTLQQQFPSLYPIAYRKNVTVTSVFRTILLNISFWRGLVHNNLTQCHRLVGQDTLDRFVWGLLQNGVFTVSSMYNALITDTPVACSLLLWKLKIPHRIKIFWWYLRRGVVLTRII